MRFFAAAIWLVLVTPAVAEVSSGKEFYIPGHTQTGTLTLTHKGKRYTGHVTITVTPRTRKAAKALHNSGASWQSVTTWGPPARFIAGRLICAVNVNAALAARGIQGTGSRLAKSFLQWGRPSGPAPGAVAVYNRGRNPRSGHVAIVDAVLPDGRVVVWNPSPRGWVRHVYGRQPIAYRVAG